MKHIEARDIEKKLNALDLIILPEIAKNIPISHENNIWFYGQGGKKSPGEFSRITAFTDIIEITRHWVEGKLAKEFHLNPEEDEELLYQIMIALLTECKLSETDPPITPPENWWSQITSNAQEEDLPIELIADIQSRDTRRILFQIIPIVLGIECGQLMKQMNLQFPDRSSVVDPEWVERYMRGDRYTQSWIYHTPMGKGYFLVLFTRRCQYANCSGCNLHLLGCQDIIKSDLINLQVETAICHELLETEKHEIREIVLSNNGSIFDQSTLPQASLLYFVSKVSHELPNLRKIVFETRIEPVDKAVLEQIKKTLAFDGKNIQIELAVGVEIFDDKARNEHYKKNLRLEQLEKLTEKLEHLDVKLRCYMMYKALPGMTQKEADKDIVNAIQYFNRLSRAHNIDITTHINPTYVAIGTPLAEAFEKGEYTPPDLADLRKLILSFEDYGLNIYVGINDEGLSVPGGSFIKPGCEDDLDKFKKFNFTGDYNYLK